jgi:hypothetical protein
MQRCVTIDEDSCWVPDFEVFNDLDWVYSSTSSELRIPLFANRLWKFTKRLWKLTNWSWKLFTWWWNEMNVNYSKSGPKSGHCTSNFPTNSLHCKRAISFCFTSCRVVKVPDRPEHFCDRGSRSRRIRSQQMGGNPYLWDHTVMKQIFLSFQWYSKYVVEKRYNCLLFASKISIQQVLHFLTRYCEWR